MAAPRGGHFFFAAGSFLPAGRGIAAGRSPPSMRIRSTGTLTHFRRSGAVYDPSDSESGVIQFENVGLRYGLGSEILRDLSFKIAPHSFQFLSGPSGAGKTSLLRLLFLSLRPTRGLISLF